MKMRKGSGECGCLIVILLIGLIICWIDACRDADREERRKLKKMECDAIRESARVTSIREKILEEEVRQLKALIPTNVTLKIELSDIIKEQYGSTESH